MQTFNNLTLSNDYYIYVTSVLTGIKGDLKHARKNYESALLVAKVHGQYSPKLCL